MNDELSHIVERIGALLAKAESPDEKRRMVEAICQAMAVKRPWQANGSQANAKGITLNDMEHRLLCLTVSGLPNKSIARELDVSVRTVHIWRNALVKKFGAGNRAELVRRAIESGYCN